MAPSAQTNATPSAPTIPFLSTTVGASVDSFYRSAMNAKLNARLTNAKAPLFPNMHIQTPVRIAYINGIKNLRFYLENRQKPLWLQQGYDPSLVRWGVTLAPGILMTPFSSILEASNAGHMNPEPLATRWIRGLVPRTLREVIFAIGLNQVSDWCREEVVPASVENPTARTFMGSIAAGVMAGYLSHVPHNLSTLKLLKPNIAYGAHFQSLLQTTVDARLSKEGAIYRSPLARSVVGTSLVFLLPKGVVIRTTQIVGSFVLVNGTIAAFDFFKVSENLKEYAPKPLSVPATKA